MNHQKKKVILMRIRVFCNHSQVRLFFNILFPEINAYVCIQHSDSGKEAITKDNVCRLRTPFLERNCRSSGQNAEKATFYSKISSEVMNRNEAPEVDGALATGDGQQHEHRDYSLILKPETE